MRVVLVVAGVEVDDAVVHERRGVGGELGLHDGQGDRADVGDGRRSLRRKRSEGERGEDGGPGQDQV